MSHAQEIDAKARFEFGENWTRFLGLLDEARIAEAVRSVQSLLGETELRGKRFLDIGSGSGLFSLAARRLGATVRSFDYDPHSVACTRELRRRFFPDDGDWEVTEGSVLAPAFLRTLGQFDVVYSWGVLHHTGAMWEAVGNALIPLAPGGRLAIALYNHQPVLTGWWKAVKRGYLQVPRGLRGVYVTPFFGYGAAAALAGDLLRGTSPLRRYRGTGHRGMSLWYDWVDWVGGWPFEAATPREVQRFLEDRGLVVREIRAVGSRHGCNEFVFDRPALPVSASA